MKHAIRRFPGLWRATRLARRWYHARFDAYPDWRRVLAGEPAGWASARAAAQVQHSFAFEIHGVQEFVVMQDGRQVRVGAVRPGPGVPFPDVVRGGPPFFFYFRHEEAAGDCLSISDFIRLP